MMRKNNRKCICCGEVYTFCPSCQNTDSLKPSWYLSYHNENCKNIFQTVTKYCNGIIDKEIAGRELESYDLSYKERLLPDIQEFIKEVEK